MVKQRNRSSSTPEKAGIPEMAEYQTTDETKQQRQTEISRSKKDNKKNDNNSKERNVG